MRAVWRALRAYPMTSLYTVVAVIAVVIVHELS